MGQRDFGFLLVPILALLAMLLPGTGSPGKAPETPAPSALEADASIEAAAQQPRSGSAAALIADYYGPLASQSELRAQQCLIATLPDPIDAGTLSYAYDRYMDAIQRAMEAGGYVLDRFDVPWLDKESGRAAVQKGGVADIDHEPRFRKEPARLLFRRAYQGRLPALALVFVVGETPTAGIHKVAFRRALDELSATCVDAARNPVKVLGPSFSGSDVSLHVLLASDPRAFRIVSGSATAVNTSRDNPNREVGLLAGTNSASTFRMTLANEADPWRAYLRLIAAREETRPFERVRHLLEAIGWAQEYPTKVALLVEGNTGYGQQASNWRAGDASYKDKAGRLLYQSDHPIDLMTIPFPLHVSSLRAVARDESGSSEHGSDAPAAVRSLTHINTRETSASRGTIPLMSQLENASSDIVLSTLLENLEEEHVRYVGLVATDIRDRIFLAEQIHHHLPNSVLFMFNADLLYAHPDKNVDLRGTQVVTTYPLFAANHDWTPASSGVTRRLLFSTHTAQGVYNAALALLDLPEQMQEYGYPFDPKSPPPLWLSVVGSNRLQPVKILGNADARDMVPQLAGDLRSHEGVIPLPYHPWLPALALVVCVLPAVFVLSSFTRRGSRWRGAHFASGPLAEIFSDTVFEEAHRLQRRLYLYACWAALTSAYLLTMAVFLLPLRTERELSSLARPLRLHHTALSTPLQFSLVAGGLVMLFTLGLLAWHVWCERAAQEARTSLFRTAARLTVGTGSSMLVALSGWVAYRWMTTDGPAESMLLYLRAADFWSGVSPLLPLFLVCSAGVAWAVSALRRLRLIEGPDRYPYETDIRPETPNSFLGLEGASFEGITGLERSVLDAIGRNSATLPWTVLLAAVGSLIVAWARLFGPRSVPSGEGAAFDSLFALGFLAVYVGLTLSFVRFVSIWRRLFRLLQRLAWHPTVQAYARLQQAIPGKPKINLAARSQIFTALEFSVDRAGALVALGRDLVRERTPAALAPAFSVDAAKLLAAEREIAQGAAGHESAAVQQVRETLTLNLEKSLPEKLEPYVLRAQQALHAALDAEARGDWRAKVARRTEAEQQLALMAREVTKLVRPAWRLPSTGAPEKSKAEPNEFEWFELAEDFLTSRVAAFLSHVVPQLQNLVVFVTAGLLMMLLAVTSYPFQPHQLLLMFNTTVILGIVGVTLVVFVQMERETILSVLSDTQPGRVNWNRDFVSRLAVYVGLPIISLLGAQFPEVAQQLFTWTSSFFGTH